MFLREQRIVIKSEIFSAQIGSQNLYDNIGPFIRTAPKLGQTYSPNGQHTFVDLTEHHLNSPILGLLSTIVNRPK